MLLLAYIANRTNAQGNLTMIKQQSTNITQNNFQDPCFHNKLDTKAIILMLILVCIFVIGLIGNGLVAMVLIKSKKLKRHPANLFVASLNVCNTGVIICCIPLKIHRELHSHNFCFPRTVCYIYNFGDLAFHICSVTHLFVMAVERFVAVKAPFYHKIHITKKRTIKSLIWTWLYSFFWIMLGFVPWQQTHQIGVIDIIIESKVNRVCILDNPTYVVTMSLIVYIIPMMLTAILHWTIFRTASNRKQKRMVNFSLTKNHSRRKEAALSKTIAMIFVVFAVCWLPAIIVDILVNTRDLMISDTIRVLFTVVMPAIPACLFPLIYIKYYEKFREEIRNLRRKKDLRLRKMSSLGGD